MKRQKHLQKRLLSLLCCLCLVVGLFVPMGSVSAAGAEITVSKAVQTPFVKKAADGTPALQGVDATITAAADGTVEITATVAAKGKTLTYTERVEVKSGTNTVRIHVPDTHELLEPTETATLTLSVDNAVVYTDEQWQRTRHWTFYLSQTMHCDLGYTNYQEDLPALYSSFIETVKQYMEDTDAQIEEEGWTELYKYAIEGQWVMQGYMEEMNAEDVQEVLDLIEEGRMIIGGGMGNQAQECFSTEDLLYQPLPGGQAGRRPHHHPADVRQSRLYQELCGCGQFRRHQVRHPLYEPRPLSISSKTSVRPLLHGRQCEGQQASDF